MPGLKTEGQKTKQQSAIERRDKGDQEALEESEEFFQYMHGYEPSQTTKPVSNPPSTDTCKEQYHLPSSR